MNSLIPIIIVVVFWIGWFFGYATSDSRVVEKYEAGKKFVRDSILNANDSLLGYTGIPDTISYKPELNNGGSYKIKGKCLR